MPQFLRTVRKSKWYKHEGVQWLAEGELQADALADLKTEGNTLSVWLVDDESLDRVVAALAARHEAVSNFDYALVPKEVFTEIGIRIQRSPGMSADHQLNSIQHYDLIELTAEKLMLLARRIAPHRVPAKEVVGAIRLSLSEGWLLADDLKQRVRSAVYHGSI